MSAQDVAAYGAPEHDLVRQELEPAFFARLVPGLLRRAGGGRLLDLGCGDCLMADLAGPALTEYTGLDFRSLDGPVPGHHVRHDLRQGLGPVGEEPFDVYLATFGVASHMSPAELRSLLSAIRRHARPGSIVALEGLGLHSLEWPKLWDTSPGAERRATYRLRGEVEIHPWSALELCRLYEEAGIQPLFAVDRSVQAGPKTGDSPAWPRVPRLRAALNSLLQHPGTPSKPALEALAQPLPPLPAGEAAAVHHTLAARRRQVLDQARARGAGAAELARAVWALEPRSDCGFGHGITVVGRVA